MRRAALESVLAVVFLTIACIARANDAQPAAPPAPVTPSACDVEVVESTPQGLFDDAALTAVRKWVYEPRKENGVAVPSQSKARLVFEAE